MALYVYQALSKEGKKIRGTLDAPSIDAVRQHLVNMQAFPISIEPTREGGVRGLAWFLQLFSRVTVKDKILFTKQLAVLLRSGVPLLQAMELMIEQFKGKFRLILIDLKDGIKEGQSLAAGLSKYPKIFDATYTQLVRAGEASGKLETILEQLVVFMERRQEINKKVTDALRQPIIQLGIVVLVVIALMTLVIPQIAETLQSMGTKLPFTTRAMIAMSDFFINHYIVILIVLIVIVAAYKYWSTTASGARIVDNIKLRIPIVGYFTRMGTVVQFSRTLGMLLAGGVNLAESLDIVVQITNNRILKDVLNSARDKIIKEGRIADFLKQTGIFPPIAIYLIKTGEQSGKLDTMLLTVAQNYEKDLAEYSDNLSGLLAPVMQILLAGIVGFVIMAVMGPLQSPPTGL